MELDRVLLPTVIAKDVCLHVLILFRHLLLLDHLIVQGLDRLWVHNAFPADGTCNIHFLIVSVTFVVHRVSATEENWGVSA